MQTQIVSIGNSYGLRLPRLVLEALNLEKSSQITIQLRKGSIVLRPAPKPLAKQPRAGWFDAPQLESPDPAMHEWQALDAASLNDPALDAEWQW
jgi:antitoxin component of MazEF toxin-antitoxin module